MKLPVDCSSKTNNSGIDNKIDIRNMEIWEGVNNRKNVNIEKTDITKVQ